MKDSERMRRRNHRFHAGTGNWYLAEEVLYSHAVEELLSHPEKERQWLAVIAFLSAGRVRMNNENNLF